MLFAQKHKFEILQMKGTFYYQTKKRSANNDFTFKNRISKKQSFYGINATSISKNF